MLVTVLPGTESGWSCAFDRVRQLFCPNYCVFFYVVHAQYKTHGYVRVHAGVSTLVSCLTPRMSCSSYVIE